jgi:arylsulfatase A-like enzyme
MRGPNIRGLVVAAVVASACRGPAPPVTQRLVDLYKHEAVVDRVEAEPTAPRLEWRFDGPAAKTDKATIDKQPLSGIADLAVRDGHLIGRTTTDFPILDFALPKPIDDSDLVHEIEVRVRVDGGGNLSARLSREEKVSAAETIDFARAFPWSFNTPLLTGGSIQTYTFRSGVSVPGAGARHVLLRPTDVKGAHFEIESLRVVSRREHLQGVPSGVGWQGLGEIYRETLVGRAPETIRLELTLPSRPWLDLAVGTIEDEPVTFRVGVTESGGRETTVLCRTVTRKHRWESVPVDLAAFGSRHVAITLSLESGKRGTLGFWGGPTVRTRGAMPPVLAARDRSPGPPGPPPQGVIVIWADTLRRDHLGAYGYSRPTSPFIDRLAKEGALFKDAVSQASWTKVSTPSLLTSLYPTTHGVAEFSGRLPAAARTLAEVYREAGYATACFSSVIFIGKFTNLHQGFAELHEASSLPDLETSKTARDYVDRLGAWLGAHRDAPFFVLLHVTDPHDVYKPNPPYDTLFAPASGIEEHERQYKEVKKYISEPLMKQFGMPSRKELEKAGFDADAYVEFEQYWYDGSIRGMDAEIARLVEQLGALGLDRRTLVVFTSDHGEEFLEHGRMFHGQTVYGEQNNVPLILWQPGLVPAAREVTETVRTIDIMPTLLAASGLPVPAEAQGQSLWGLLSPAGGGVRAAEAGRLAISEKARTTVPGAPPPQDTSSVAITDGTYKLVHNRDRAPGAPEYELFEHGKDPLDQRDVAAQHPDVMARLVRDLEAWQKAAEAAKLKPDSEAETGMSREELERLRALGYIQ